MQPGLVAWQLTHLGENKPLHSHERQSQNKKLAQSSNGVPGKGQQKTNQKNSPGDDRPQAL